MPFARPPVRALSLMLLACVLGSGCGKPAATTPPLYARLPAAEDDSEAGPQDRLPGDTHPLRYQLTLEIVPERATFRGRVTIDLALDRPRESIYLHAKGIRAGAVRVLRPGADALTGRLETVSDSGLAALRMAQPVGPGVVRVEIEYEADFGGQLAGLYHARSGGAYYAFTQFEAISARLAFPCFDEPRFKTPFDVTLRVKREHAAIANTRERDTRDLPNGLREVRFVTTEKLPTYLVAWAVGPFDVVRSEPIPASATRKSELPLRGIAVKGRGHELAYALRETPRLLGWLEDYFGIAYPYDKLDIIAVPDFAAGAMENAGAITFRDQYLLMRDDAPEGQRRGFAYVMGHELAHQWFGNLVTMPWWDDIWLNEAFATWMGTRVVAAVYPEYESLIGALSYTHYAMEVDSQASARQIRQPVRNDHDIENAFDAITYSKGGAVLTMFERFLGPETFREGIRAYMRRYAFATATAKDLTEELATAARNQAVDEAFFTFLEQPGVPLVQVEVECSSPQKSLLLSQSRYAPLGSTAKRDVLWQVPVCVRFDAAPEPREACTLLTEKQERLPLGVASCPRWVMPNAGAQGYYRWSLAPEALRSLVAVHSSLPEAEQMSLASNVFAALRAGTLPADRALEVLGALGTSKKRLLLEAVLRAYAYVSDALLDEPTRALYRAELGRLLRPTYESLGLFPQPSSVVSGETKLLRALVVKALALSARDPALLHELAGLGRAQLGLTEDPRLERLPSELVEVVLAAAVQEGGAAVLDKAIEKLFAAEDGLERSRLLSALSSVRNPDLTGRVLSLALDPRLRINERLVPVMLQHGNPETRERAYTWLKSNFDALVAKLSAHGGASAIAVTASFCSEDAARDVRAFFGPRADEIVGAPRELELALESIRLCTSLAQVQGEAARGYFSARAAEIPPKVSKQRRP